ncbi:MAG: regulatory protein GemA [Desulfobulbus sp.]
MSPSKSALARIHIAKKELGLADEVYRDILGFNFGVESARDLTEQQALELIELFKAKGWEPKPFSNGQRRKTSGKFIEIKPGPAAKQQRKVLALWHALGYDMNKLHARVKKQFGVDRFEWLDDHEALHILITDLEHRLKTQGTSK